MELWLHLYVDGECGSEEQAAVETHLAACEDCARSLHLLERTRSGLRHAAEREATPAPAALRQRIETDVASVAGPRRPVLLGVGFGLFLLGAAAAGLTMSQLESGLDPLTQEVVSSHAVDVPVDVASPDPVRVASYLHARLGEPVHVPAMDKVGLGLRGGRVVSINGARAARILYTSSRGEQVSVIAIPDHDGQLSKRLVKHASVFTGEAGGYQMGAVRLGPTLFTVIGDVEPGQMHRFTHHLSR